MSGPESRLRNWKWQKKTGFHGNKILDGDQSVYFNRITNLGDPVEPYDAANKKYVESFTGGGISDFDVAIFLEGTTIKVVNNKWYILDTGTIGVDDTRCFDTAVDSCPHNGKLFIGPGTFTLEANKVFYLTGDSEETQSNPFYYAIGVLDGKNINFCGSGVGSTILKMAPGQHSADHHAVMIINRAHWWNDGATMFMVTDMTLDGNRAEQEEYYYDGSGIILTGSIASNFRFQRLWIKDSFGYGVYCGNNGSGPAAGLVFSDIRATNCYKTAIMTDTVRGLLINNCLIEDCNSGIECVGNQPDYLTRDRDSIVISDTICHRAGITLWTVNDVTMNSVYMDCTGAPMQYGLIIHSAIRVMISASKFLHNTNFKYSTFIDANTYMEDGPCDVFFNNCDFEGSYAFRILGEAKVTMHGGRIWGHKSCVYMVGEIVEGVKSPVACKLYLIGVELLALQPNDEEPDPTLLLDVAPGGYVEMDRCFASKTGYLQMAEGSNYFIRDCTGAGLEGHNSRWRKEDGTYLATPPSTSIITTLVDRAGTIVLGTPICYQVAGVKYIGTVKNVTINTITISGPPITGDIEGLYLGVPEMINQVDYLIPGAFASAISNTLIKTFKKSHSVWRGPPAYLVAVGCIVNTLDSSGAQPYVNVAINGNKVITGNGLQVASVVQSTTINIDPARYRITAGDTIEITTTKGTIGNASDLTMFLTFVSES